MAEQDRERWMNLVADFESCALTQRKFTKRARRLVLEHALLDLPAAEGVAPARHGGGEVVRSSTRAGSGAGGLAAAAGPRGSVRVEDADQGDGDGRRRRAARAKPTFVNRDQRQGRGAQGES